MNVFTNLWDRSLDAGGVEEAQRYVRDHLEEACRESPFGFWSCSDARPVPLGRHLFIGIAEYDRTDLELLDFLCTRPQAASIESELIHVFSFSGCTSFEALARVIPGMEHFPAQNPLISLWVDGECSFAKGGWTAKQWLRAAFAE